MKDDQPHTDFITAIDNGFGNTENDLLEFFLNLGFTPCKAVQLLQARIFPSIFYYRYLVVKNHFSIKFQNSILHLLSFQ